MIRRVVAALCGLGVLCGLNTSYAVECQDNPNALGTSRVISVDPTEHARIGTMQYAETLPLADKEVVLTFDDGPLPRFTAQILTILASECVRATFFIVGNMARTYPNEVQHIYAEGHTIGTHSQNHPKNFKLMPIERVHQEVENGIAMTAAALGNPKAVAPFFRIPGLSRSPSVEAYLSARGLMTWSIDFHADDWKHLHATEILNRALQRIEDKGRGILLLHDIHAVTVEVLSGLLDELKARGYRIVHVVPASIENPKTVTAPEDWITAPTLRDSRRVMSSSTDPQPQTTVQTVQVTHRKEKPLVLRPVFPFLPPLLTPVGRLN
jgi:peptidoglycan/xylan/chitin deacetylase (PgdA/CDA1 family)